MKTFFAILFFSNIFLISSCTKDDPPPPDPVPTTPKPDTLSAGWKKIIVGAGIFGDIFFNNNTVGYLAGEKAYKSVDGGQTWNLISNRRFDNIAVTNNGNVYFAGFNDSIYRSTDGGSSITATKAIGYTTDIFFTDNNNGYCATYGGICNTTDGGLTWNKINATGISFISEYTSIFFSNTSAGWSVSRAGVYKTSNAGINWTAATTFPGLPPTNEFLSVFVTPNSNIYICNKAAELYRSVDGGVSFSQLKAFPGQVNYYCDIHFVDNNTGYVSVSNRIYKTTDAGTTWNVVVALGEASIVELHFTDASHGWACGSNGTVLVLN
jgi:photosystem II stability/assembly factor-like uncharacterized protein